MKKLFFISSIMSSVLLACNQNPKQTQQATTEDHSMHDQCYQAITNADTLDMHIHNHDGKVQGSLAFRFKEKQNTQGDISGEFRGDTLFVDYSFDLNGTPSKNPLVFLKQGEELSQGYGEIETYLGKTYFKPGAQIDFGKGFNLKPTNCK
ncbi:hypothetical protein Pedsa_0009 [Pseudopedobacter saltans DSM 12145]|uniref:Lipoprotein n=1 Tax=Pseudopedobacter saltans (strain ATCC 51119 / DSM 12145 / JCM 21818 / CCUG 39354 / LMG 10337 / NBRC 100064 / NCIMB 13643) TaxID=762903 RepID=F0SC13_PSESL|nr:hypothetical protein [Pseudopedobacter saltans]ADY50598.1 hypothetical protein Pedsa_0009 [Pseudopedobacter saltans DSM 12145]